MSALLEAGSTEAGKKVCNTFFREMSLDVSGLQMVAGTGPRSLVLEDRYTRWAASEAVRLEVRRLKMRYADRLVVVSGGAEGFDELWFKVAADEGVKTVLCLPSQSASFYAWGRKGSLLGRDRTPQLQAMLERASFLPIWVDQIIKVQREDGVYALGGDGPFVDWERGTSFWKREKGTEHINMIRNRFMIQIADGFEVFASDTPGTQHCLRAIKQAKVPYRFV